MAKRKEKKYDIPAGVFPTRCRERACNARIYFVPGERGGTMPVNEDGTTHFGTCSAAKQFSKGRTKR